MLNPDTIYINVRQTVYAVRLDTILYMEQESREITVHLTEGEKIRFYALAGFIPTTWNRLLKGIHSNE